MNHDIVDMCFRLDQPSLSPHFSNSYFAHSQVFRQRGQRGRRRQNPTDGASAALRTGVGRTAHPRPLILCSTARSFRLAMPRKREAEACSRRATARPIQQSEQHGSAVCPRGGAMRSKAVGSCCSSAQRAYPCPPMPSIPSRAAMTFKRSNVCFQGGVGGVKGGRRAVPRHCSEEEYLERRLNIEQSMIGSC
jgi:hypothetical protein